ncbi:uncharacterized protein LOC141822675 isoform X1 [Curcuma longa]|uniref:uncharacterized protein LOC141822675 isoform X1 n=1 Tax=Curcuma longa TaxID=136217 RepID=UPI003D9E38B4
MQLAKYEKAKDVWDHLKRLYVQSNFAKQYQLENDIRALKQNHMSIQEFYSAMSNLWDQLALNEPVDLQALQTFTDYREQQRLVQFLMALRDDFEGLRGTILHRHPLPSVDDVVNELLAEEIRLKSTSGSDKGILPAHQSVFAAPFNKNKSQGRVGHDECSYCKEKGHWKAQCPKLLKSQKHFNQFNQKNFKAPSSNIVAAPGTGHPSTPETTSQVVDLAEQFQKFLATQSHAMSASSLKGLHSSSSSGSTIREADWDRP